MTVTVLAPAKLTLSLRITGLRADGYHFIDAEMTTLDLADRILIEPSDEIAVTVVPAGTGMPVPADASNLVARALVAVERTAAVTVYKAIPAGSGLGGGSSDAAAILRWAGVDDLDLAARLGADVPFCVVGGRARVRGVGEQVEPLAPSPQELTLFTPPYGVPTPAVYRAWDEMGGPVGLGGNDLEPAALEVEPRLRDVMASIAAGTSQRPRLAGSGGTWFVDGDWSGLEVDGMRGRVVTTA